MLELRAALHSLRDLETVASSAWSVEDHEYCNRLRGCRPFSRHGCQHGDRTLPPHLARQIRLDLKVFPRLECRMIGIVGAERSLVRCPKCQAWPMSLHTPLHP